MQDVISSNLNWLRVADTVENSTSLTHKCVDYIMNLFQNVRIDYYLWYPTLKPGSDHVLYQTLFQHIFYFCYSQPDPITTSSVFIDYCRQVLKTPDQFEYISYIKHLEWSTLQAIDCLDAVTSLILHQDSLPPNVNITIEKTAPIARPSLVTTDLLGTSSYYNPIFLNPSFAENDYRCDIIESIRCLLEQYETYLYDLQAKYFPLFLSHPETLPEFRNGETICCQSLPSIINDDDYTVLTLSILTFQQYINRNVLADYTTYNNKEQYNNAVAVFMTDKISKNTQYITPLIQSLSTVDVLQTHALLLCGSAFSYEIIPYLELFQDVAEIITKKIIPTNNSIFLPEVVIESHLELITQQYNNIAKLQKYPYNLEAYPNIDRLLFVMPFNENKTMDTLTKPQLTTKVYLLEPNSELFQPFVSIELANDDFLDNDPNEFFGNTLALYQILGCNGFPLCSLGIAAFETIHPLIKHIISSDLPVLDKQKNNFDCKLQFNIILTPLLASINILFQFLDSWNMSLVNTDLLSLDFWSFLFSTNNNEQITMCPGCDLLYLNNDLDEQLNHITTISRIIADDSLNQTHQCVLIRPHVTPIEVILSFPYIDRTVVSDLLILFLSTCQVPLTANSHIGLHSTLNHIKNSPVDLLTFFIKQHAAQVAFLYKKSNDLTSDISYNPRAEQVIGLYLSFIALRQANMYNISEISLQNAISKEELGIAASPLSSRLNIEDFNQYLALHDVLQSRSEAKKIIGDCTSGDEIAADADGNEDTDFHSSLLKNLDIDDDLRSKLYAVAQSQQEATKTNKNEQQLIESFTKYMNNASLHENTPDISPEQKQQYQQQRQIALQLQKSAINTELNNLKLIQSQHEEKIKKRSQKSINDLDDNNNNSINNSSTPLCETNREECMIKATRTFNDIDTID